MHTRWIFTLLCNSGKDERKKKKKGHRFSTWVQLLVCEQNKKWSQSPNWMCCTRTGTVPARWQKKQAVQDIYTRPSFRSLYIFLHDTPRSALYNKVASPLTSFFGHFFFGGESVTLHTKWRIFVGLSRDSSVEGTRT